MCASKSKRRHLSLSVKPLHRLGASYWRNHGSTCILSWVAFTYLILWCRRGSCTPHWHHYTTFATCSGQPWFGPWKASPFISFSDSVSESLVWVLAYVNRSRPEHCLKSSETTNLLLHSTSFTSLVTTMSLIMHRENLWESDKPRLEGICGVQGNTKTQNVPLVGL